MKTVIKKFSIFYFISLTIFTTTTLHPVNIPNQAQQKEKNQKLDVNKEIENCIFLEKQLIPQQQNPNFIKKIARNLMCIGVPIATGFLLSTIISRYILKNKKYKNRTQISAGIFFSTIILLYFVLRYLTKPKELTDLDRLTNFIKNWPTNKNFTPEKFSEKFEKLYSLYQKSQNMLFCEVEAEKFVHKIIMEAIEYKIYLQYEPA